MNKKISLFLIVLVFLSIFFTACDKNSENVNINNWALNNTGQIVCDKKGIKGVDINILNAWKKTKGTKDIIVAIIDTGIDINNDCITDSILRNDDLLNGIDDDNNGYIDDLNGWNFYHDNNEVFTKSLHDYHGTNIASLIIGKGGVDGVAPNVSILPVKFLNGSEGDTKDAISAIKYAKKMGASIVNCSWDSNEPDDKLKQVMTEYDDMLFVCSAGKNGNDLSQKPVYPACFDLPNIVSVAAIDSNGKLIRDTGYGQSVDVAAPGENIFVSFPSNEFDYVQGTSYATAYVTGIAALVKSYKPDLHAIQIAEILKKSSDNGLEKINISSGGFIDADQCLKNAKRAVITN